jgi:beta-mannosidase
MADQVRELFGVSPDRLEEFALASQVSQAEAKKFFVEMIRLGKWRRAGVIWWNLMDGWPQFSDAVVDYYFQKKLAYHYLRRAQQPVCLMISEPEAWTARVIAGNDSRRAASGTFEVRDASTGERLLGGAFGVDAGENRELGVVRVSRGEQRLLLLEWQMEAGAFGNHSLLGSPPFSLDRYRSWLPAIARLEPRFDPSGVAG